jgi:predicted membrane protein
VVLLPPSHCIFVALIELQHALLAFGLVGLLGSVRSGRSLLQFCLAAGGILLWGQVLPVALRGEGGFVIYGLLA